MDYGTTEIMAGVYLAGPPVQQRDYSLENPNLPLNDQKIWEAVFNDSFGTASGVSVTAEKSLMYAPFYHGVTLISGDVAKLPRPVYKRRPDIGDDARERDRGHRLNYILNTAWNEETEAIKGWERFVSDAIVYRNGYARILFDGAGNVSELYNLLPDRTHCEYIDGKLWYVTEAGGKLIPLYPWEVLHVQGPPLCNGSAPLFQMARNAIALGLAQEKFASKFFANGGRVGGILELPMGMPKPARDTIEEGFRKAYEGADNPFKTVILRDNAKFHAAQQSPTDSQLVEATEAQTRAIAHFLNLAPSKLGLSDSVSYNSKAEDNQNYLDTTLQIWLTRIESACNFRLLSVRQSDTHFIEHNTAALLKMNLQAQADSFQKLIAARVMNPNECRAKLNMLPYDGGDEFVNPNTMKSGNDTQPKPAEDDKTDPTEDSPPADKPVEKDAMLRPKVETRDAGYLRVLFRITSIARDRATQPNHFLEWIDGKMSKQRAEWRHLWGDKPFPFDALQAKFRAAAEHYTADDLPTAVNSICESEESQWNAE